jgi:phosphatidylglycerophosphate synthase
MSSQSSDRRAFAPTPAAALRLDAGRDVFACLVLLALLAGGAQSLAGLGPWFHLHTLLLFCAAMAPVLRGLDAHAPHRRFGPANRVTLARLALIALLAAGIAEPGPATDALAWAVVAVATTAACLDALDGPLARAHGTSSAFGARFDMETDALMVLVLSLLVVRFGKAGPWLLAAGLMRYAFVFAARGWPMLARPLPPSTRRKAVCVLQITALIVCLGPIVPLAWSRTIAAASLIALSASFAADIVWLARRRTPTPETAS